ncbi:MAG: hypothetical protein R3B06_07005 [Kofleriaceae bacterium]
MSEPDVTDRFPATLRARWDVFVAELAMASSGAAPFPVELLSLPVEVLAAGQHELVRSVSRTLLHQLTRRAEILAPSTVGPNHHALAATVAALRNAGIDVGAVLEHAGATWAAPQRKRIRQLRGGLLLPLAARRR